MKVYHGSCLGIEKPRIEFSRDNVDFGKGFYVTTLYEQAENWAQRFAGSNRQAIVSVYELDEVAFDEMSILEFDSYSEDWIDFVLNCRRGIDNSGYDIVMGGVANDKVFNTVELYFDGLIDKVEALKRLKYEKPNFQIALRNQRVIDLYLKFIESSTL